jgi:hypothetical protein
MAAKTEKGAPLSALEKRMRDNQERDLVIVNRDPEESAPPVARRSPAARSTGPRPRPRQIVFEVFGDQDKKLKSFRRVDISVSAILRAVVERLADDPELLAEILDQAAREKSKP